jgi:hypothetical protein
MNHLWRGFLFSGSRVAQCFYFYVNIMPLYIPTDVHYVGIGSRLFEDATTTWEWDETRAQEIIDRLVNRMESKERELLDKLQTPADIARTGPQLCGMHDPNRVRIYALSLVYAGEFGHALPMLEELCIRMTEMRGAHEKGPIQVQCETILELLKRDPALAKAQLLEWEQQTIKNLRLERYVN